MMETPLYFTKPETGDLHLCCPTSMPKAGGFLWNSKMMLQMTCRGFATAQFMQPEPSKYAQGPSLEATTFMQPEHPYFAHHPGRFFYIRDNQSNQLFSAPYEPVKQRPDAFEFISKQTALVWRIRFQDIVFEASLRLAPNDPVEIWDIQIKNTGTSSRDLSLFPYFPIGYKSWMNQSADYDPALCGIVADCVTPYQKVEQYFKNTALKDKTFLLSNLRPHAWLANQELFEGEGGLSAPASLEEGLLPCVPAHYELPAAILQFNLKLVSGKAKKLRLLFGPAKDEQEILALREKLLQEPAPKKDNSHVYRDKQITLNTPDEVFNDFVNNWLARQVFYHGDVNRLSTDPQTRNYLQDHLGMAYFDQKRTKDAFVRALSQQYVSGEMPDGILLDGATELKYINQVPHADHCVWLPLCLRPYLDETNDYGFLQETVPFQDDASALSVSEHIDRAMDWLITNRDPRGLSYIKEGDWCDPMNMVGYKGKGVSAWLTLATAYALNEWAAICDHNDRRDKATYYRDKATEINVLANEHFWDGAWFARGITDDNVSFGVSEDTEGRIFLNPQSWALLSGAATPQQKDLLLANVERQLATPYGPVMLSPAYTGMREDVGRVTQKYPGSAENGSVYNHAAIFYCYSLYQIGEADKAFDILRRMLPNKGDALQRGQLPTFIPNYYRGAYHEYPRTAGRSSQLFNTGTVAWYYRCIIEELFGIRGDREGVLFAPQLPSSWETASAERKFRGAIFSVEYRRGNAPFSVTIDGEKLTGNRFIDIQAGQTYQVAIDVPAHIEGSRR